MDRVSSAISSGLKPLTMDTIIVPIQYGFEVFYRFPTKDLIVCGLPGVY